MTREDRFALVVALSIELEDYIKTAPEVMPDEQWPKRMEADGYITHREDLPPEEFVLSMSGVFVALAALAEWRWS